MLAESGGRTTIRAASAALDLAPSTVHRLLDILLRGGMVERDKEERSYTVPHSKFSAANEQRLGHLLSDKATMLSYRLGAPVETQNSK
jgi:predicted transcriptional regulator